MSDYSDLYSSAGQQYGVDPALIQSMAQQESSEDPQKQSPKGAMGVMQLMPDTAKSLGVKDATDPTQNIPAGARYLAQNRAKYQDDNLALMAYNWGPGNVDKWIKNGANPDDVPDETKDYLKNVTSKYQKTKQQQVQTPLAYTQNLDPIQAALSAPGGNTDKTATPAVDPIVAALSGTLEVPEDKTSTQQGATKTPSATEDVAKSIPGAIIRGVGAIPQMGAYLGNFATQLAGQGVGGIHDAFSETPYTAEQHNRLNSVEPFYTGATLGDLVTKVGAGLTEGVGGSSLTPQQKQNLEQLQQNGLIENQLHNPETTPGKLVSAGIEGSVGGNGANLIKNALSGVGAEVAHENYPDNPFATAVGGAVAPGFAKIGGALQGNPIHPATAQLAKNLDENYGIKIPGYQLTNNPAVQRIGSFLERFGFSKDNNASKFNEALADSMGAPAGESGLTPDVMNAARKANSAGYNAILNKIGDVPVAGIPGVPDLDTTLSGIIKNAQKTLTTNKAASLSNLNEAVNEITDTIKPGDIISAKDYKSLTNSNSTLEDLSKNPDTRKHAVMIENALHDTLKNAASPDDVSTLNDLDMKWKNMRTLQGLAAKSDITGQVSPASLITPVAKSFKDMAYSGAGDLGTLAKAGKTFKSISTSNTGENNVISKMLGFAPEALATGGAYGLGAALPHAALAGAATYGLGKTVGAALSSNWYRNYLINNALKNSPTAPTQIPNSLLPAGLGVSSMIQGQPG